MALRPQVSDKLREGFLRCMLPGTEHLIVGDPSTLLVRIWLEQQATGTLMMEGAAVVQKSGNILNIKIAVTSLETACAVVERTLDETVAAHYSVRK